MVRMDTNTGTGGGRKAPGLSLPSRCGSTQKMEANIKVVVRVRPSNNKESNLNHRVVVDVVDDRMLLFDPKEVDLPFFYQGVQQPSRSFLKRPNKELKFVFDRVCDQTCTNSDVFNATTKDIIPALMEGYNCSVFVYGATGAGKTFTMIGNNEHPGITYLTMEHLFQMINSFQKDREFDIAVSYIEVYNENVFDLLKPSKTPLQLREDTKFGVMVAGLTLHNIKTAQDLLDMLDDGNKNRTQHPTDANAESSRSHAVFQVYVNMRNRTSGEQRVVKLSMIDLAGSERAAATGCVGERFKEGANINRSLLSLGNCINKLADGSAYIPYRDSKLTRLLKDSLGGNCKTIMIANISPSSLSYEDTYNTLKYAARANKIQLSIKKNIVDGNMRVSQYVKMNEELMKKVKELEAKLAQSSAVQVVETESISKKALQWRLRIEEFEKQSSILEEQVLGLMSRQRVLALRQRLRARAFAHVADLAHRSSTEAMQQVCNEDIPRHERAAENYAKQTQDIDKKIKITWLKWKESKEKLDQMLKQALSEEPSLQDFVANMTQRSEIRYLRAERNLGQKQLVIQNDEINAFSNYMVGMPSMLKKLYLTLKGYDKVTPSLTEEYLGLMKAVKSGKAISWTDTDSETELDSQIVHIFKLDMNNPSTILDNLFPTKNGNANLDYGTESVNVESKMLCDEKMDIENVDPKITSGRKRKLTPMRAQNDTIIIDDSMEDLGLDTTRTFSSGKKIKQEFSNQFNNMGGIDTENLNSTFVMAGKVEVTKKTPVKSESIKKALADIANVVNIKSHNIQDKGKLVKPNAAKTLSFRKPITTLPAPRVGFGSSMPRDPRNGIRTAQTMRGRDKINPYTRTEPRLLPSRS